MRKALSLVAMFAAACGSTPSAPVATPPAASAATATSPTPAASGDERNDAFPQGLAPNVVGEDREWHRRAIEAVAAKDFYKAKRIFLRLVAGYRKEKLFADQHEWVQRRLETEAAPTFEAMKKAKLEAVPPLPPSFRSTLVANVPARPMPKLAIKKMTTNRITDEARWFQEAGPTSEIALPAADTLLVLHIDLKDSETDRVLQSVLLRGWLPEAPDPRVRDVAFPPWIPPSFGTAALQRVILSEPFTMIDYGERYLFVFDGDRKLVRAIDLFTWLYPESHIARKPIKVGELKLTSADGDSASGDLTVQDHGPHHDFAWAQVRDGILYVSTSHNGYSKEVKGQTAYVFALDLASGEVVFRSAPLTSNSHNFVLVEGAVVTGYGFTAEPDFIFTLDAASGKTMQKLPVPNGPEYFSWHEDRGELLVRTYDRDLVLGAKR